MGIHGVAAILGFSGGIWLLLLAFEEDAMTGLLYLFLPCFSIYYYYYYFFSRFDGSMPFQLTIASWVLSLIAVSYGAVIGAAVSIP